MELSLDQIPMSVRAKNCCRKCGISTLSELQKFSDAHNGFFNIPQCGKKTAQELKEILKEYKESIISDSNLHLNSCASWEEIIEGLSDVKKALIELAFNRLFLLPKDEAHMSMSRLQGLSPAAALTMVDFMFDIVPNKKEIDKDYCLALTTFRNEVKAIIAMSDTEAEIKTYDAETFNICNKFLKVSHEEQVAALRTCKAQGTLPLFRLLLLGLTGSTERNDKIYVQSLGLITAPKTFEEIGAEYNLTRERIRQLVNKGHRKTRGRYKKYFFCGSYPFLSRFAYCVDDYLATVNASDFSDREPISLATFTGLCKAFDDVWELEANGKRYFIHEAAMTKGSFQYRLSYLNTLLRLSRREPQYYPLDKILNITAKGYQFERNYESLIEVLQALIPDLVVIGDNIILPQTDFDCQQEVVDTPVPFSTGKRRLQIKRPDKTIIEVGNSNLTFCEFVKEVGWEQVRNLQLYFGGKPLFGNKEVNGWYKEIAPGWYLCTKMSCAKKIEIIKQICKSLGVRYKPSMTDPIYE